VAGEHESSTSTHWKCASGVRWSMDLSQSRALAKSFPIGLQLKRWHLSWLNQYWQQYLNRDDVTATGENA
jgi:hypothetical protein